MTAPIRTALRGAALLNDPVLNKGTAFSREERRALGLEALLPWQVETIEQQVERCWSAFRGLGSALERYAWVQTLRERNLTLFHRFLADHIEAVMPIVYTPTVGEAIQQFSLTYRTPSQGLYLSAPQADHFERLLREALAGAPEPQLLLITDAQGILGIGDQGVGGIHICQGKLAVYTLCAGLDPARGLPLMLDVGTDRPELLADPRYPGLRQPRLVGDAYDAVLERFVAAAAAVCPNALLHWEDFGAAHARPVLDRFRQRVPSFNDDIQGTSGVACGAILAGLRGLDRPLAGERIVIFGAGSAGCGIAERLLRLLQHQGLSAAEAAGRLWLIDRDGLLVSAMEPANPVARLCRKAPAELAAVGLDAADPTADPAAGPIGLEAVVEAVRPGVLIGTSTVAGAFHESVVRALLAGCDRPIVLPLSNPTRLAEATPEQLLTWSNGRILVATGSPFAPVPRPGGERVIGQCNNCFVFPGLGFAAMAVGAREVSEAMIDASIEALADAIPAARDPEAALMPPIAAVQAVSQAVAEAVACTAVDEGLARCASSHEEALAQLAACRWLPEYPPVLAA
jgi:malate dehydrogenase (oxaloacetate-decarboxylating)